MPHASRGALRELHVLRLSRPSTRRDPARIEAAFLAQLERFSYGASDTGQDMSGLVTMVQSAYDVLSNPAARER